jgi:hypothetical protein
MANQSLINAAQRMYSAKAQKTDLTPIVQGAASSIANIMNAVAQKRSRQEKESVEKVQKPFIEVVRDNPNVGAQLTNLLEEQQEEYFEQQKLAEGVFRSRSTREDARKKLKTIEDNIINLNKSLSGVDLKQNLVPRNKVSQANSATAQVMDVTFNDKETLAQNIIIKKDEEGNLIPYIKGTEYKEGEESGLIKLDDYESAIQVHQAGFDALTKISDKLTDFGLKGVDFEASGEEGNIRAEIAKQLDDQNGMSLYFDNFEGFNWAQNQLLDPKEGFKNPGVERDEKGIIRITDDNVYQENLQKLRDRVSEGKLKDENTGEVLIDYAKELEDDLIASFKMVNQKAMQDYEERKQEQLAEFNRRNLGKESDYYPNVFGSGTKSSTLGLIKDIESGRVKTPEGMFRRDKDGLFYQEDNTKKGKLRKEAKGLTAAEMAQELMITQYVEELGYSDIFKTKKPQTTNVELPAYTTASILDPTGDVDKDGIINTADKINVPFPTDKSFPGK